MTPTGVYIRIPLDRWDAMKAEKGRLEEALAQAETHAKEQERQRIEMDEWAAKRVGEAEAFAGRLEEALRALTDAVGRWLHEDALGVELVAPYTFAKAALAGGTPPQT